MEDFIAKTGFTGLLSKQQCFLPAITCEKGESALLENPLGIAGPVQGAVVMLSQRAPMSEWTEGECDDFRLSTQRAIILINLANPLTVLAGTNNL